MDCNRMRTNQHGDKGKNKGITPWKSKLFGVNVKNKKAEKLRIEREREWITMQKGQKVQEKNTISYRIFWK